MNDAFIIFVIVAVFFIGHFHGYARAMRYCTKRLEELAP